MEFTLDQLWQAGAAALALAAWAWFADRRRMRRSNPDAVGFVCWRDVAFWSTALGLVALSAAFRAWVAGA